MSRILTIDLNLNSVGDQVPSQPACESPKCSQAPQHSLRVLNAEFCEETSLEIVRMALRHGPEMGIELEEAAFRIASMVSALGCVELSLHERLSVSSEASPDTP